MDEIVIGIDNYDEWPDILTPKDVAQLNRVDPKTVTRWAQAGKIESVRTPGGHHRFRKAEVKRIMDEGAE